MDEVCVGKGEGWGGVFVYQPGVGKGRWWRGMLLYTNRPTDRPTG
jgi:hypothetical protein